MRTSGGYFGEQIIKGIADDDEMVDGVKMCLEQMDTGKNQLQLKLLSHYAFFVKIIEKIGKK